MAWKCGAWKKYLIRRFAAAEKIIVIAENLELTTGQSLKIMVNQVEAGTWQSSVEVDLGRTGTIVFENTEASYATEEEAREAVLALAVQNLSRSRLGKNKS